MKLSNRALPLAVLLAFSVMLILFSESSWSKPDKGSSNASKITPAPEDRALVGSGDPAPDFTATTIDKDKLSLFGLRGKVVLLNFFAIWCPACRAELPHIENEVWQRFKSKGIVVLLVGREHSLEELKKFKTRQKLTMPVAADPKREIYAKFARTTIPRNFVIGRDGKVLFESQGFEQAEFAKMINVIEAALASNK